MCDSKYLIIGLIFLFSCKPEHKTATPPPSAPIKASRKFNHNTLTVSVDATPPIVVSLWRNDTKVYANFLERPGSLDIDILPFRKDWGSYEVQITDGVDADTTLAITIDQAPPRRKNNRSSYSTRGAYSSGKYRIIRDRRMESYIETLIICTECNTREKVYYSRYKTARFTAESYPNDHYTIFTPAAKEACKKLCRD